MRKTIVLAVAATLAALVGCDAIESQRPPLTVERQQPEPNGPSPTEVSDVPGAGKACWTDQLPPEPQPPAPSLAIDEACGIGASADRWSFPTTATGTSSMKNDDHRGDLVGRWVACGQNDLGRGPHDGIEFAGNGRWRYLARDASGVLVAMTPDVAGYYYVLGDGQVNLMGESFGSGLEISAAKFANGERDVLGLEGQGPRAVYARTAASPSNGDDNAPSVSDGRCSLIGDWDVPANEATPVAPASTWSFDGLGNFVVGPRGGATCNAHTMHGTYRLSAQDGFQITTNWNLGLCDWWFGGGWPATFDATCAHVTLTRQWDNCTGGRGYLNGDSTTLTRRQ